MQSLIMSTCKSSEEAEKIGKDLLQKKLVACAKVIQQMKSMYWWKGKIQENNEVLLLLLTKDTLVEPVMERVKKLHSYEVPEIVELKIEKGNEQYIEWMMDVTL